MFINNITPKKYRLSRLTAAAVLFCSSAVWALSLSDLTEKDANAGLKSAMEQGSVAAVSKLGAANGFLDNDKVRIKLPSKFDKVRSVLQLTGQGQKIDDLEIAMNRAAETAVPMAKPLLINAVKSMTFTDAKKILAGGDTSVTDFFREKTSASLAVKFLPLVKGVTDKAKLAQSYNSVMTKAQALGLASGQESTVEAYVTKRAAEGLYVMIAEEEKAIRRDPVGTGSKIIGKVFGALN